VGAQRERHLWWEEMIRSRRLPGVAEAQARRGRGKTGNHFHSYLDTNTKSASTLGTLQSNGFDGGKQ